METFLLDSSTILNVLFGSPAGQKASKLVSSGLAATSIICYCEVLNKSNVQRRKTAEDFLSTLVIFPVSFADGKTAVEIQDECRKEGGFVPSTDCLIAATATNHSATVLTSDKDFERIRQVKKIILTD